VVDRTTEERLAELEARVSALEAAGERATETPRAEALGDVFFALNALRERVTGHGGVVFAGVVRGGEGEEDALEWQQGLPVERLEESDWARHAASLDALGNPVRLQLLHAVWRGTGTVAALAERSDFGTTGQIYHHVNLLAAAGWLTTVRRGHYVIPPERVVPLLVILTATGGAP
jgi:hypothetical protein